MNTAKPSALENTHNISTVLDSRVFDRNRILSPSHSPIAPTKIRSAQHHYDYFPLFNRFLTQQINATFSPHLAPILNFSNPKSPSDSASITTSHQNWHFTTDMFNYHDSFLPLFSWPPFAPAPFLPLSKPTQWLSPTINTSSYPISSQFLPIGLGLREK